MKIFVLFNLIICLFAFCTPAHAQITLTENSDMDFGAVEYSATHSGTLSLGTNSSLSAATTGISIYGSPSAANISITGSPADVIEIKCEDSGTLKNGGGTGMSLTLIEAAIDTGGGFGSGVACDGIKKNDNVVATVDLGVNSTPTLLLGGRLTIPTNNLTAGTWATNGGGGAKDFTIRVVFQ